MFSNAERFKDKTTQKPARRRHSRIVIKSQWAHKDTAMQITATKPHCAVITLLRVRRLRLGLLLQLGAVPKGFKHGGQDLALQQSQSGCQLESCI